MGHWEVDQAVTEISRSRRGCNAAERKSADN
jgi:hypothetical protein